MAAYRIPSLVLRMVREHNETAPLRSCRSAADAAAIARAMIGDAPVEHLIAILLDGRGRVTGVTTLAQGSMHGCAIAVRDVLRAVLVAPCSGFVLAHNHPSGDPTASPEDRAFTAAIAAGAKLVGVPLLDHVIVTAEGGFSSIDCE